MEIEDVKPNSHKYKEEQKKKAAEGEKRVEKVVKGQVKTKKKGELSKFAEIFISEDIKSGIDAASSNLILLKSDLNITWISKSKSSST